MRGQITVDCPGCTTRQMITIVKPGFLKPSSATFICIQCESTVMIRAQLSQTIPGKFNVQAAVIPSTTLKRARQAIADLKKAKEPEDAK